MIEDCKLFFLKLNRARRRAQQTDNWCFFKGKGNQRSQGLQDSDWHCTWQGRPGIVQLCRYQAATKQSSNIWWLLIANHCFSAGPSQLPLHQTLLIYLTPRIFPVAAFPADVPTRHHQPWCLQQPKLRGCGHFVLCTPCSPIKPYFPTCTVATMCQPTESLQDTRGY